MLPTPAAPWGTSPDIFTTSVLAPRQSGTSTGVRRLFGQHMCYQRREKASQESGQHIPEEVLHGSILLLGERAHANLIPKSRSRRNAERPGSLPAFVVCCELYRPDYFAMQVAQKLLNSAISASLSWPCISVSRSLSAMSAWVNSCVATFP